jgi:hypothetical protein
VTDLATATEIVVRMGEIAVSRAPDDVLVSVGLGSCIGLALVCRHGRACGLAHVMLPESNGRDGRERVGKYADRAVPTLLERARAHPAAVVTGAARYDDSVPNSRKYGRWITHVWVWINTLSLAIRDSMCGFRVYPLAATLPVIERKPVGRRMDFDTDLIVRLHWRGVPVHSLPVSVHYPLDGVSHFDLLRDNLRISLMHARLFFGMLWRLPRLLARRWLASPAPESVR